VRASIDSSAKGPSLVEKCARRAEKDMRAVATTAGALALAGALAFGNVNTALADVPDNVPKQLFLDDAGVVQKTNGGYVEKVEPVSRPASPSAAAQLFLFHPSDCRR